VTSRRVLLVEDELRIAEFVADALRRVPKPLVVEEFRATLTAILSGPRPV
jgi:hypothetical protein